MKTTKHSFTRIATLVLMSALCFAASSFAATPLNYPRGLAVDSKGNLYLANYYGSQVLVYNPSYVQIRTISQNVNGPTGVAIDPVGNLWVANYGNNTITEYGPTGVQNTAATLTVGVQGPAAIAVDGLGNVWVENGQSTVVVYDQFGNQIRSVSPPGGINILGLAASEGWIAMGGANEVAVVRATWLLAANQTFTTGTFTRTNAGLAIAADAKGNFYIGSGDDSVVRYDLIHNLIWVFATETFPPAGLAVDSVRGRIYVANELGNAILVYNTAGALLHTIQ